MNRKSAVLISIALGPVPDTSSMQNNLNILKHVALYPNALLLGLALDLLECSTKLPYIRPLNIATFK